MQKAIRTTIRQSESLIDSLCDGQIFGRVMTTNYHSCNRVENSLQNQCRLGNLDAVLQKLDGGEDPNVDYILMAITV